MKKLLNKLNPRVLPYFTLAAGILGFILRLGLADVGFDKKGLLKPFHPVCILLYVLTALTAVCIFLSVRPLNTVSRYKKLFPPSMLSAVGCVIGAASIVFTALEQLFSGPDFLTVFTAIYALAAAVCLTWIGMYRQKGRHPAYLLQTMVTVFLMLELICQYRHWSPDPQTLVYFFPLLASVCLMITSYHATCLDARRGKRRLYVLFNQLSLYFCFISVIGDYWPFYLSMGIWAGTNLCSTSISRSQREVA